MISTKIHGYLDYLMGFLLILLPLHPAIPEGAASTLLVVLGAGIIVYSLITDYEMGLLKILAMKTHLIIDVMGGILLLVSPWLFGFADELIWPFVVLGIFEIGAGLFTSKKPSLEANPAHRENS
jgi:FtsH-binding integral membrane protein